MAVLGEALDLLIQSCEHGLALSYQASTFRLKSQVPNRVEDDFEFVISANFHEL